MAEADAPWALVEARVDYFSGTTDNYMQGGRADERARELIENERMGGSAKRGQSIQGYSGIASEHIFTGQSERGTYVRLSSDAARDYWDDECFAGLRCSRIDLCATATTGRDIPDVAYSIRYGVRLPARNRGKPLELTLYSSTVSGDTVYVGSPGSVRRGRVYDKSRESPGAYPLGSWHWEVQLRHVAGENARAALESRAGSPGWINSVVHDWYHRRGITPPWSPLEVATLPTLRSAESDDARRLKWLKTSIAPMLDRMKARYTVRELRQALGLQYEHAFYKELRDVS